MQPNAKADIIALARHTCMAVDSFSKSQGVRIVFTKGNTRFSCRYNPGEIIHCLSQLLCRMVALLPAGSKVTIDTAIESRNGLRYCNVMIRNTEKNLSSIPGLTNNLTPTVVIATNSDNETCFTIPIAATASTAALDIKAQSKNYVRNTTPFYEAVRKRLQGHFSRSNNYLENLEAIHPKKAAFLRRINDCITENVSDENFDVTALSRQMSMSRTQLFRKLKPIISQAPANYMRDVRLQKAKELLEAGEDSVSEVACKTGFKTPSHFTKVFTEKYGIRPSFLITAKRV